MARQLPSLPALQAFEAAARHESFAAAALELNVTQATVSHRVRQLERRLGAKLFERLPRRLALTEIGKAYLPALRKAFDDLSSATAGVFGPVGGQQRALLIRASLSFAVLWLAPRLDRFAALYPDLDLRLTSSIWAETRTEESVDLEIRFGHGAWPGYAAERLTEDRAVPYCSPETKQTLAPIKRVEDLTGTELVHILSLEDLWQRLFASAGLAADEMPRGLVVDSTMAALEMASASRRVAIAAPRFAENYVASGRLVRALDVSTPMEPAHYLVTPLDGQPAKPEALLFKAWLLEQLAD